MPSKPLRCQQDAIAFCATLTEAEAKEWLDALDAMWEEWRRRLRLGEDVRLYNGSRVRMDPFTEELFLEPVE